MVEVEVEVITNNRKADSDAPPRLGLASDGSSLFFASPTPTTNYTTTTTIQHAFKDGLWTSKHDDLSSTSTLNLLTSQHAYHLALNPTRHQL